MAALAETARLIRSPYHDAVVAAGVTDWSIYNRTLLPLSFGDLQAEYRRLTEGVALWDVSCQRQVQIEGRDAEVCVQYLTARDLSKMRVGQGRYVAMCDHDGRLLNDPVLLKLSDGRFWFSIADSDMLLWCRAIAAERGFDVQITDPNVGPLAVQGPKAADVIADVFGESTRDIKFFGFEEVVHDGIKLVLCRSGWSHQGGFELFLESAHRGVDLWNLVAEAGEPYGIGPGGPNHVERVEAGLLAWGGDTTPDSNPFEAGMARYVDVDCEAEYIGKAALMRVVEEGPARQFVGLMVEGEYTEPWPLPQRAVVRRGSEDVGTMSALVRSPKLDRTIGLAQITTPVVEASERVEIESPSGPLCADIVALPFV
ncbi:MAG: glycine cleavage system protein T [Actinomycetia bacterium]|nr:glycine cleavage system protein T [Actinomycetes bacterium]MCP4959528.1 glycine cleavage system protein T [Actinomycetes bacterium]